MARTLGFNGFEAFLFQVLLVCWWAWLDFGGFSSSGQRSVARQNKSGSCLLVSGRPVNGAGSSSSLAATWRHKRAQMAPIWCRGRGGGYPAKVQRRFHFFPFHSKATTAAPHPTNLVIGIHLEKPSKTLKRSDSKTHKKLIRPGKKPEKSGYVCNKACFWYFELGNSSMLNFWV